MLAEAGIRILTLSKNVFDNKSKNEKVNKKIESSDEKPDLELNGINNWKNDYYPYSDVNWDTTGESWENK